MAGPAVPIRQLAGPAGRLARASVRQGVLAGSGRWAPQTCPPACLRPAELVVAEPELLVPPPRRALDPSQRAPGAEKALNASRL